MKKRFLIFALIVVMTFSALYATAELLNITTEGVDGNWVIYDASKNIICTFDAANRKLTIPSGSTVNVQSGGALTVESGGTFTLTGYVAGKIPVSSFATIVKYSPTSAAMDGHLYRIASAQSVYLPLGSVGMTAIFRSNPGTVSIHPSTNDHWQYAASVATADSAIQVPGAIGNYVRVVYGALSVWEVTGNVGTITVP